MGRSRARSATSSERNDSLRRTLAWGGLLVVLTCLVYGSVLRNGFVWDDDAYVEANPTLRDAAGLRDMWLRPRSLPQYYPLVHTTFWIEYQLGGLDPRLFHATNVAIHVLSALVLWRLLVVLSVPGAWFAAMLFALHPVHVESVAWITERKNVLSGLLYLSAALAFVRFNSVFDDSQPRRWNWYAVAVALLFGALLSKSVTATFPAAVLVVAWWHRGWITRGDLLATGPLFALSIPIGLLTVWLEQQHVGAQGELWEFSFVERVLIAGRACWFYVAKLVSPRDLTFIYPRWAISATVWWQYLFPVAAAGLVFASWAGRRRLGRGPLAAVLLFGGTLFPTLGFFNVYPMRYSFVADHFQYHASIAMLAFLSAAAAWGLRRFGHEAWSWPLASVVVVVLSVCSWSQCLIYFNRETLWLDTLQKNPDCEMASTNLGGEYLDQGRFKEALPLLRKSVELVPDSVLAHNHLGVVLANLGETPQAIEHLLRAVQLDPDYAEAQGNLGALLTDQGELDEAVRHLRRAIELHPRESRFHYNLGRAFRQQGMSAEADASFATAKQLGGAPN